MNETSAKMKSKWYNQAFKYEWMSEPYLKGWLKPYPDDRFSAYCLACKIKLKNCNKSSLKTHSTRPKHLRNMENNKCNQYSPICGSKFPKFEERKILEIARKVSDHEEDESEDTMLKESSTKEHELDLFARSIAAQMKILPEKQSVKLTLEIQNLVTQARLEAIENNMEDNSGYGHKVITVQHENQIS